MLNVYSVDPISIKHLVSRDKWQEPTWTTLALMGHVERKTKLVINFKGEQVIANGPVLLPSTVATISHEDRLIIDGVEHAIITIERLDDFSRLGWELWIQ